MESIGKSKTMKRKCRLMTGNRAVEPGNLDSNGDDCISELVSILAEAQMQIQHLNYLLAKLETIREVGI